MSLAAVYLQLFWVFFKQGLLGFGGGYVMLSLMQHDVVDTYGWLTPGGFADIVALSQTTPGPIAVNAATYVGYNAGFAAGGTVFAATVGSVLATLSVILPSLFFIWVVLKLLLNRKNHPVINGIVQALKLVSVALIASVAVNMANGYNFADYKSVIIFVAVFALSFTKNFRPIPVIIGCALLGLVLY